MTDPKRLVADYYAAFNARDAGAYERYFSTDVIVSGPGVPGFEQRGLEVMKRFDAGFWAAFPDCQIQILESFADDGLVMTRNQFRGTHEGPLSTPAGDLAGTGAVLDRDYATRIRIEDGRITEFRIFYDRVTLLEDLGLLGALAGPR